MTMMDFSIHYMRALELIPPDTRENFMHCLSASMAVYLDDEHVAGCIERALYFAQGFKSKADISKCA